MDQRGDYMKMNFDYFQIQKWMLKTVRTEKVDSKNGAICLVLMFPSWVMVLKLSKKVHFLQFCSDLRKKPKSVRAIYMYYSWSSHYTPSESAMFIGICVTIYEILAIKIPKKMLT